MNRRLVFAIIGAVAVLVGGISLTRGMLRAPDSSSDKTFDLGGPFQLTAHDGQTVNQGSWPGKLLLISFGYRFCPDICPTALQTMATTLDLLKRDADQIQPLFISVDPERDTPHTLAEFVPLFHPRLVGLTGTPEQIAAVAKSFAAYYRKSGGSDPANYTVDHSAYIYLADGRGKVVTVFPHNAAPEEMAASVRTVLQRGRP
jgi:protein SCO1/2